MRRASHKRTASVQTTTGAPSAESVNVASAHAPSAQSASLRNGAITEQEFGSSLVTAVDRCSTEVLLSPDGTFVTSGLSESDVQGERHRELAIAIRQRIESRLAGRVRDLAVRISGNTIVLEGRCATYYSKQLAQHAALGVLDDEQLENAIVVVVPR